jgi:hypothetical protein
MGYNVQAGNTNHGTTPQKKPWAETNFKQRKLSRSFLYSR